jgi:hypothetical protein
MQVGLLFGYTLSFQQLWLIIRTVSQTFVSEFQDKIKYLSDFRYIYIYIRDQSPVFVSYISLTGFYVFNLINGTISICPISNKSLSANGAVSIIIGRTGYNVLIVSLKWAFKSLFYCIFHSLLLTLLSTTLCSFLKILRYTENIISRI